jgi:hypothetical protein
MPAAILVKALILHDIKDTVRSREDNKYIAVLYSTVAFLK